MADDKKAKGGKKAHKNKPTSTKYKHYKIDGAKLTRAPFCPRCGPGVFLANRDNRMHCGRCNYTEFGKK
jgi:small subunit ribosomal protein S27Ae